MNNIAILIYFFLSSGIALVHTAQAAVDTTQVRVTVYASTNVTTGAYVQIESAAPSTISKLQICDTSGQLLKLATGQAGNEKDILAVPVSGCILVPMYMLKGTRLSLKAINATASTGFNTVALIP